MRRSAAVPEFRFGFTVERTVSFIIFSNNDIFAQNSTAMMIQIFTLIVDRIVVKLQGMLSQSWGWAISAAVFFLNFIEPVVYSFISMGVAVGMDLLFGMMSARKQKKFILSQLIRDTPAKVIVYVGFMLVVYVAERNFGSDVTLLTKGGCALACGCELWSMAGSALIIWPKMLFPKLLKLQLKGEIEAKLGKNISNLLDKEDDKYDNNTAGNPE